MKIFVYISLMILLLTSLNNCAPQQRLNQSTPGKSVETTKDTLSFLPKGTTICAHEDNRIICFLPRNTEIQGILCRGHKHDWQTVFYTNGKLALAWLAQNEEIQGVLCKKASFWTEIFGGSAKVQFHDNGKLSRCKLAKDFSIEGQTFKKGDIVYFDREGKLIFKK